MAADEFRIEKEPVPEKGVTIVKLSGYLDAHTFERLEQTVDELFSQGAFRLVVDLANVEYISSAGAGVLISALQKAQEQKGNIVALSPQPNVREVFDLLGLTQFMKVVDERAAAIAEF